MKRFVIFLPGPYRRTRIGYFKKLCRSARTVAVDGGCRFFMAADFVPDIIIGDLDSIRSIPRRFKAQSLLLTHSPDKDKSDLHLALEYAMGEKARAVDIVSPVIDEVDHFLGNVMLLELIDRMATSAVMPKVRIVAPDYEILWVHDSSRSFSDCAGDRLSVIPMSAAIKLTCRGTEYPAERIRIGRGHSRGLRNRIIRGRASVTIEGKALLVHYFSPLK